MPIDLTRPTSDLQPAERIALINAMREQLAAADAGSAPMPTPEELRYSLSCIRIERSRAAPSRQGAKAPSAPARPISVEDL